MIKMKGKLLTAEAISEIIDTREDVIELYKKGRIKSLHGAAIANQILYEHTYAIYENGNKSQEVLDSLTNLYEEAEAIAWGNI